MNNKDSVIANISTILKIFILILAPAVAVYLGTDDDTAVALLTAVFGLILGIIDAKYPNTIIGGGNGG